jgi:hypothetical protein
MGKDKQKEIFYFSEIRKHCNIRNQRLCWVWIGNDWIPQGTRRRGAHSKMLCNHIVSFQFSHKAKRVFNELSC